MWPFKLAFVTFTFSPPLPHMSQTLSAPIHPHFSTPNPRADFPCKQSGSLPVSMFRILKWALQPSANYQSNNKYYTFTLEKPKCPTTVATRNLPVALPGDQKRALMSKQLVRQSGLSQPFTHGWWSRPGVFSVSNPRDVRPTSWMLEHDQRLALARSLVPLWRRHFNAVCIDRWNPRQMGMSRWAEPQSRTKREPSPPCWPRQRHTAILFSCQEISMDPGTIDCELEPF